MKLNWNYQQLGSAKVKDYFSKNVSSDSSFPQLDEFYDEEMALNYLSAHLEMQGWPYPQSCKVLKVWYLYGKQLHVFYRLSNNNSYDKDTILLVRFLQPNHSSVTYQKIVFDAENKKAIIHIPEWSAVASVFPEDPALSPLRNMLDLKNIAQCLEKTTGTSFDEKEIAWDLMSYQPGKRCTIRYRFRDQTIIGKVGKREISAKTHDCMIQLWESPERRFSMPQPIGLDVPDGIRWESYLEDEPIRPNLSNLNLKSLVKSVSRGMLQFHSIPLEDLNPLGIVQILQSMEKKIIPKLYKSLSPLSSEVDAFFCLLTQKAKILPPDPCVTIHGDAHTANILIDGDQLSFIDLDAVAAGSPAYDLARFGSRLFLIALMKREHIGVAADIVAALPEGYEAAGGSPISPDIYAWYLSAILVGKDLYACVKNRASDLGRLGPILIELACKLLESGRVDPLIVDRCLDH